jgi:hypothetical protein
MGVMRCRGMKEFTRMEANESQTPSPTVTPVQTADRTDDIARTDRREVTEAFVARANARERQPAVEEDSADVYLSERCSPLNDF